MKKQVYNWKRFWCPRSGTINLSDRGYLFDPDSEYGRFYNSNVVPFEAIAGIPCLVLLGEPGIGKSTAMTSQQAAIERHVAETGGASLWINLRAYQSEDRLCRAIFENPVFLSWLDGEYQLHLFLDSLDECLLRIDTIAALLLEELKKYPVERLYLRIACRTADWPNGLEEGLKGLWGDNAIGVYELAPLRRVDVIEAVKTNGLNPDMFLREIDRREVVPFAIKPVTLQFLLNIYKRDGCLPSTQTELYLQGCNILCEEISQSRRDAKLTGQYSAEQRLSIAARIAAVTVFAGRYAIWTGLDLGDVPEEDITIRGFCGDGEFVNGSKVEVSEDAVREALDTGLFSSRGPIRMGWAHQTYAEFLAAWYLVKNQVDIVQIMNLILHPGDPEGKIVPQLHETSAWLASMVPEVFREIMKVDPELLLRSDVATADVKDREALVESLLRLYDEEKLLDFNLDMRRRYGKLLHPRLAEQLKPYIANAEKGLIVRRMATDIAEECGLRELQGVLADIALDPSQYLNVRVNAAHAVCKIGDEDTKARLKPLTIGEAGDDPDDELKGCGLKAVWPANMTAEELFAVLTRPKRNNLYGSYKDFIRNNIIQLIAPQDLQHALKWEEKQQPGDSFSFTFEGLEDEIMLKAWKFLEQQGILESFARVALSRQKNHDGIIKDREKSEKFRKQLSDNEYKRRQVLGTIIPMIENPKRESIWIIGYESPLAYSRDIPWMIECMRETESDKEKLAWGYLIDRVYDINDPLLSDAIYLECRENPVLAEIFSWLVNPVDINSPEAHKMREDYLTRLKWQERRQSRPLLDPLPEFRIASLLDECESGNVATAWWRLNMEMTLEPDSTHYGDELESNLTNLPGWKSVDSKTRGRIVEAAKKYLFEQDPQTSEWLGTNNIHRPAFAGYRALLLLLQEVPEFLLNLPAAIWKKWAPIIIAYPVSSGFVDEGPHQKIVNMAYPNSPAEIIKSLLVMIDKENRDNDHIYITRKILGCWDGQIAGALLIKVKEYGLKPKCMGCLLSDLLEHGCVEAKEYAKSLITVPAPESENERQKAVVAARVLMCHTIDAGWAVIWPAIQDDPEFGREVITEVAREDDRHSASVGRKISEEQLAVLFIWLAHQFPYSKDPVHDDAHWVRPRESVANWRNSILSHLKNRGTFTACEAIQRIYRELPGLDWLKWILHEAKINARRHTWTPHQPEEILKIAANKDMRLVNNGDQLLGVIIESIKRLEKKLQGETPAVADLWNEKPFTPKDENRFSDYVKRHLDEDLRKRGIIINREVEIRRGTGAGTGERTDIHVDAVVPGPRAEIYDSISVIIEVKGCWNTELDHAMKTQLADRYLKDNRCQHGFYLVGWFYCDQWDDSDKRKKQTQKFNMNIDEAKEKFNVQAKLVSQQSVRIKAFVLNTALR
ncbi:MAG: NACHT domain-containing protein [Eubacteriales bacterium]